MNWNEQAANSHYQTAVAIRDRLVIGDVDEARNGIEELIDALSKSERRALQSQLVRLMAHVIKWKTEPQRRSRSWILTIRSARRDILAIQEETPSLSNDIIRGLWQWAFDAARGDAEIEVGVKVTLTGLTWEEVFVDKYEL